MQKISIALLGMFAFMQAQTVEIINNTEKPLILRWYKTKLGGFFSSYPIGDRLSLSEPFLLDVQEKKQVTVPREPDVWDNHFCRAQLLVSYNQLIETVTLQDIEHSQDIGIFDTFDTSLTLHQPLGTHRICSVKEHIGWQFENKTHQPLYIRFTHTQKEWFRDSQQITVLPKQTCYIPFPETDVRKKDIGLFFSFNQVDGLLPDHTQGVFYAAEHLFTCKGIWHMLKEAQTPVLVPFDTIIRVLNMTNKKLHCALYYTDNNGADKFGASKLSTPLEPHLFHQIHYPAKIAHKKIQLLVVPDNQKRVLKQSHLSKDEMSSYTWFDFESVNLLQWYLKGEFAIYADASTKTGLNILPLGGTAFEHLIRRTHDITELEGPMLEEFEQRLKNRLPLYTPQQKESTSSLVTKDLTKEKEFIKKRSDRVRTALNTLFGEELIKPGQEIPRIAFVFTGGGYRAMIETIGFLKGAAHKESGNIFDCALYMTGLSGSTWAINPLVISGLDPIQFSKEQRTKVGKLGLISLNALISNLINKSISYVERRFIESRYGQSHGPVGVYGHALAQALLEGYIVNGKPTHHITLTDLQEQLKNAQYPLPISVAIDAGKREEERIWYEFSPYYCGTHQEQGSWIPSEYVGCIFKNGTVIHQVPEYPIAQFFGIWGSAFAVSVADIAKESALLGALLKGAQTFTYGLSKAYEYLLHSESSTITAHNRFTAAELPNFNYDNESALKGLTKKPVLYLIDGGITKEGSYRHNFATIPALSRQVDMVIMCDCIETPNSDKTHEHLLGADEEAKRLRLPFPDLTRSSLHKKTLKHIEHDTATLIVEQNAPVVVYMKAKRNKKYDAHIHQHHDDPVAIKNGFDPDAHTTKWTATSNFYYTPDQYDLLSGLTESIIIESKETIKQGIKLALDRIQKKKISS